MNFHHFDTEAAAIAFLEGQGFRKVFRGMWQHANGHMTSIAHAVHADYFVVSTKREA